MANFFGEENRSEDGTIWTNAASPGRACFRKTRAVVYSSRLPIVQALITCVIVYKIRSAVSQLPAWLPVSIFLFGLFREIAWIATPTPQAIQLSAEPEK
ncbi:hypothetical protein ColTof4_13565 [Colletotrichum tofieldiae]|nr:hypothetical protein ColTof4_13565 [Colletotrichum tofieldiae]